MLSAQLVGSLSLAVDRWAGYNVFTGRTQCALGEDVLAQWDERIARKLRPEAVLQQIPVRSFTAV